MRKNKLFIIIFSVVAISALLLSGCDKDTAANGGQSSVGLFNGGFETGDLTGWTVEYGDAFSDDCVSSHAFFTFPDDANDNRLSVNHTGSWYLTGKGYHGKFSGKRTGAIRSTEFTIPKDGVIKVKLAGGALTIGKGENAPQKSPEKTCYLGVYTTEDDKLIGMQHNDYFHEHTEDYVNPDRYDAGVYNTDNFYEYTLDLSEYAGKSAYIRIVDNDQSYYYSYFAVDDIRLGEDCEPQIAGTYYLKERAYVSEASAPSEYDIANGDFELGSLVGWTVTEGEAFSDEGVNSESVWWNEHITYGREGNYHYGYFEPSFTGVMRSSVFTLGGSGYISYMLGGCADNSLTYLRVMMLTDDEPIEIARYSNFKFWNFQFPYVANGMRLLNMVQYYADLSPYIGEELFIEVVDNNSSADDLGCITLDSVITYHEEKPVWYDRNSYFAAFSGEVMIENEYQVENGGFETGDLTGWTIEGNIGSVTDASGWWAENLPYNKKGIYLFSGISSEAGTGYIESSPFTLGGCGYITYLLGGGADGSLCYVSVYDAETKEELCRFHNRMFNDKGISSINHGSNLANMVHYVADLSKYLGRQVRIRITDNATNNWGLLTCDSFVTYYKTIEAVPTGVIKAVNILPEDTDENIYQVRNGGFETGDLTGWSMVGNIGYVSSQEFYWKDVNKPYGKSGMYLFSGIEDVKGSFESAQGTLTSSLFTVGGSGYITFKMGGGGNELCYIDIIEVDGPSSMRTVARYHNDVMQEGKLITFKADLSAFMGKSVCIRIVDNAGSDWGCFAVDDFVTYYGSAQDLPEAVFAVNILNN